MAESGGTFWAAGFWADGFWADGFWAGAAVTTEEPSGGGWPYGKRRPYVTQGRMVPVGDTLYKQMFPQPDVASTAVERPDDKLPVALLLAWMAAFDD